MNAPYAVRRFRRHPVAGIWCLRSPHPDSHAAFGRRDFFLVDRLKADTARSLHESIGDNDGALTLDPLRFYGFGPDDVQAIHLHKRGIGDGIWFRLKDGRVFDKTAELSEADPALYDGTPN